MTYARHPRPFTRMLRVCAWLVVTAACSRDESPKSSSAIPNPTGPRTAAAPRVPDTPPAESTTDEEGFETIAVQSAAQEMEPAQEPSAPASEPAPEGAAEQRALADMPPRGTQASAADLAGIDDPPLTTFAGSPVELVFERFPDGAPKRRTYVERDEKGVAVDHGPDWRWYENQQLWLKRVWVHGEQSGPYEEWHAGGFIKLRGAFAADQRDGVWIQWYETGAPHSESAWKNGRRHGRTREWFPSGRPKIDATYVDGALDGPYVSWSQRGFKTSEGTHRAGERDGAWSEWYDDGRIKSSGRYVEGREDGGWIRIEQRGERFDESYKNGVLEGLRAAYTPGGSKISEAHYQAGKAHGLQTTWYQSGAKESEIEYVDGVQHGSVRYFFESGAKQIEGTMKDGKKEGAWSYWTPDGALDPTWSGRYAADQKIPE